MRFNNMVYGIYCDTTASLVIDYKTYQGNTKKALFSTQKKATESIKYLQYANKDYKYFVCKIDTVTFPKEVSE